MENGKEISFNVNGKILPEYGVIVGKTHGGNLVVSTGTETKIIDSRTLCEVAA